MNTKMETQLNPYLSNLVVMFLKLHDLHWNVSGPLFVQVHEHTEALYDDAAEKLDAVAEKIIMAGGKPVSKMAGYLELATIKEAENLSYSVDDVLKELLKDYKTLKAQACAIRKDMDAEGEFSVVMLLEDQIASYEKEIWFLEAMTK